MPSSMVNNIVFAFDTDDGTTYDMCADFLVDWYEDDMSGRLIMESIYMDGAVINGEPWLAGELEHFYNEHYELIQDAAWSAVFYHLQSLLVP